MTNGSITDRYTLYTLIVRVLHALYWKVGRENKRKQIGTLRHIALRISDLQKQNHRFQQRLKLYSCIVFISDYQCVRCSASGNEKWHSKWYSTQQCLTEKAESEIVPKITPSVSVCLYFTQYIFHLVRFGTRFGTRVPPRAMFYMQIWRKLPMSPSRKTFFKSVGK